MNSKSWIGLGTVNAAYLGFAALNAVGLRPVPFRICPLYLLTGVPCPLCGLTTAIVKLMQGDVLGSIHAHAMGIPIAALVAATVLFGAILIFWPRLLNEPSRMLARAGT